ncbi:MAG: DUF21 domain-containing protein [Victivallaceae bacterium]
MEYIEEVIAMLVLLSIAAFCSASETAYSATDYEKLSELKKKQVYGSKLAVKLVDKFDHALSAILVSNTVVSIALASTGAVVFGDMLEDDEFGAAISTVILTVVVLIFSEISPKLLAKEAPEKFACALAWPLYIMTLVMLPACYLTAIWKKFLKKVLSLRRAEN